MLYPYMKYFCPEFHQINITVIPTPFIAYPPSIVLLYNISMELFDKLHGDKIYVRFSALL